MEVLKINKRDMGKYKPCERKDILKAFNKLYIMVEQLENSGTPFEKLFNNETLKYDVLGNNFYTFKAHGVNNIQIRLLYRFVRTETSQFNLELHQAFIKKRTNNDYIEQFEEYVDSFIKRKINENRV